MVNYYEMREGTMAEDARSDILYSRNRYRGQVKPENLVFNANLQEFTQRVGYICNLETAGKLDSETAYEQIKTLWEDLERSKESLGIGKNPFHTDDQDGTQE